MHDASTLAYSFVLLLLWGGVGMGLLLKRVLIPAVRAFWISHSPFQRVIAVVFLSLFVAIGGNTSKQAPRTAPRILPPPELSDAQQGLGIALTEVSTQPIASLEVSPGGSVYPFWRMCGAHNDSFWLDSSTCIFSSGVLLSGGTLYSPFEASLGIVPEANWSRLSVSNSLFWSDTTSYGSHRYTWHNVLYERASDRPVSFQAELFPSGDVQYRYDFGSVCPTNYDIRLQRNGNSVQWQGPIESRFLTLYWTAFDPDFPDPDGDGIPTATELLQLHTDPKRADSDLDGTPDNEDGNPAIPDGTNPSVPASPDSFSVALSLTHSPDAPIALRMGDQSITFPAQAPTNEVVHVSLPTGIENPVSVYAAESTTVGFRAELSSPSAFFENPLGAFSRPSELPAKQALASGFIAQPILFTEPERLCFHTTNAFAATLSVAPERSGPWHWRVDTIPPWHEGIHATIPYPATSLEASFHAQGAQAPVLTTFPITTCSRIAEPPPAHRILEEDDVVVLSSVTPCEPNLRSLHPADTSGATLHRILSVNNDDDDSSHALDLHDAHLASTDNDLHAFYPLGRYDGACCPCPEHALLFAPAATLASASSRLALYTDPGKTNAFEVGSPLRAGQPLFAEGLSASTALAEDTLLWQSTTNSSAILTNAFTILSLRLFPDLDGDRILTPDDAALLNTLSPEHGWILPCTDALRPIRLQTDVDLPGTYTLSLSGLGFSLWDSATPGPNDTPLLTSGHTRTNIVCETTTLYLLAPTNGTAELTYAFENDAIACSSSLRLTAIEIDLELWARDPDTGDEYECSSLVQVSHPVPQVSLDINDAFFASDNSFWLAIHGTVIDPLSEICTFQDRAKSLHFLHNGEEIDSWDIGYSSSRVEDVIWQQTSSFDIIHLTLPIQNSDPGLHLFALTTDENLAGESGAAFAYVLIGEEFDEPIPQAPTFPLSVAFDTAPTTNLLNTATLGIGTNRFALAETPMPTAVAPDLLFENPSYHLCASTPLSTFSPTESDRFYATLRDASTTSQTNVTVALFEETSATSLCFQATAFFDSEPSSRRVILDTGSFQGTPTGFIEPFIATVHVTPPNGTAPLAFLQQYGLSFRLQGESTPMQFCEYGSTIYLTESVTYSPARNFVALENTKADLPQAAWQNHCLTFELVTTNGFVVATYDTWLTDPAFAEEDEDETLSPLRSPRAAPRASPARSWTVDDAWLFFELLFGEAGSTIREYYTDFGGTVVKAETSGWTWRSYECLNFSDADHDPPIIVLDDDLPNALQAALALERALRRTNSLLFMRYDYRKYVIASIQETLADDPTALEQLRQFWTGGYRHLSDTIATLELALEMGVSFLPGDADIVIDFTQATSDLSHGKYGTLILCLTSRLGDIYSAGKRLYRGVDLVVAGRSLRWADEVTETILEAASLSKRSERMDLLRPLIQRGDISGDSVEMLYNIGILKPHSNPYNTLQRFIEQGTQAFPGTGAHYLKGITIRHHDFPRQFELDFLKAGYDPDTVGRALSKDAHKAMHHGKGWGRGGPWNYQWKMFFEESPEEELSSLRFDKDDPYGSIKRFLDLLRSVDPEVGDWPYKP